MNLNVQDVWVCHTTLYGKHKANTQDDISAVLYGLINIILFIQVKYEL